MTFRFRSSTASWVNSRPNPDPLEAAIPKDKQEEHPIYAPFRLGEEFKQALPRVWKDRVGKLVHLRVLLRPAPVDLRYSAWSGGLCPTVDSGTFSLRFRGSPKASCCT